MDSVFLSFFVSFCSDCLLLSPLPLPSSVCLSSDRHDFFVDSYLSYVYLSCCFFYTDTGTEQKAWIRADAMAD